MSLSLSDALTSTKTTTNNNGVKASPSATKTQIKASFLSLQGGICWSLANQSPSLGFYMATPRGWGEMKRGFQCPAKPGRGVGESESGLPAPDLCEEKFMSGQSEQSTLPGLLCVCVGGGDCGCWRITVTL